MPNYFAPGVYVEEIRGAAPITSVGTSTVGFVGVAPKRDARLDQLTAIDNWSQFLATFVDEGTPSTDLSNAVYGFYANGGGRCYVVNIAEGTPIAGSGTEPTGLALFDPIDEIAIVAAPGYADVDSYESLLAHCENEYHQDRMAILDPPRDVTRYQVRLLKPQVAVGAAPPPPPPTGEDAAADASTTTTTTTTPATGRRRRDAATGDEGGLRPRQSDGGYGAFYFPWLVMRDPLGTASVVAPPSGHMAGIWARTDATRGVHKAPANETVATVTNLAYRVSREEQELLNPAGVNAIRFFPGQGIRVWGARTLADQASESRYINVRRLVNMLKESIAEGTRWIVFEPNDSTLWNSIRRDVGAYLTRVWRDGALLGRTPGEAFFVKCDAETNTDDVREAGQVVTLIGIAPVKPAEFVIFKLSQSVGSTAVETLGA